jgi:hypothetical protein
LINQLQTAKEDAVYAKYADLAKQALNKSKDFAQFMQNKTGISPILAITLTAAGLTGGAAAIPMSALMYFARKYYTKGLSAVVGYGVDKAFDAVAGKQKPELQPESFSFREWLSAIARLYASYKTLIDRLFKFKKSLIGRMHFFKGIRNHKSYFLFPVIQL